ncbi:TIGR00730 family Rossman fold protein [Nemorincola caseinilytica]|uniref:Cytokinin riboside 5'-monophosphate phosphoribohydrolase n=1 Tax=Nemorincola caseinilytica TaxID=2054315 RepID=A0ABP8NN83_9BACT
MDKPKLRKEETTFLSGPLSRMAELRYCAATVIQFVKGFRALHFTGPCVTVFGSARFGETSTYYGKARDISFKLSKAGMSIMTGGGPGLMEAANRGARDAGGISLGCNIALPNEQRPNSYLDKYINIEFFFVRKELLRKYSVGFVVMPGGFGTLDEFFETITLIQTKKIRKFPIALVGIDYHKNLISHINGMAESNAISQEDKDLIVFTDSIDEAVNHILKYADENLSRYYKYKPNPLLGENSVQLKAN